MVGGRVWDRKVPGSDPGIVTFFTPAPSSPQVPPPKCPKFAPKSPQKFPKKKSCSGKMASQNRRRHPQNGPHFFFSAFSRLLDPTLTSVAKSRDKFQKVSKSLKKSQKVPKSPKKFRSQKKISTKNVPSASKSALSGNKQTSATPVQPSGALSGKKIGPRALRALWPIFCPLVHPLAALGCRK